MLRKYGVFLITLFVLNSINLFADRQPYVFINNTGQAVNDLHVVFSTANVKLLEPSALSMKEEHIYTYFPLETPNEDKTALHFRGSKFLPNGSKLYGVFKNHDSDTIKIKKWWWTRNGDIVGDTLNGDMNKALQSPFLIAVAEDSAQKISFKNKVANFEKDRNGREFPVEVKVNDLHIVFKGDKNIGPILDQPDHQGETPKYGGRFESLSKVICSCDSLPSLDRENTRARKDALKELPEPCKTLCADSDQRLQVINLKNGSMRYDQTIELKFRASKDSIFDWWWTQDGKPLNFHPRSVKEVGLGAPNSPADKNSKHKVGAEPEEETDRFEGYEISIHPLRLEGGFDYVANNRPEMGASLPINGAEILEPVYNNPELFEKLFEKLGGEFFAGDLTDDYQATSGLGANLKGFYPLRDRLLIGLGFHYHPIKMHGQLPIRVISSQPTTESYTAHLSTNFDDYTPELLLRYFITSTKIALYGGASIGVQLIRGHDMTVELAGQWYTVPYTFNHQRLTAGLEAGANYNWNDWFYTSIYGKLSIHKDAEDKIISTPGIGLSLGIKISR